MCIRDRPGSLNDVTQSLVTWASGEEPGAHRDGIRASGGSALISVSARVGGVESAQDTAAAATESSSRLTTIRHTAVMARGVCRQACMITTRADTELSLI